MTVAGALAGLAFTSLSVPAFADSGTDPQAPAGSPADALATARSQALSSGAAVQVAPLTTETYQVLAQPDGSFTATSDVEPARVRRGDAWVPVDATLSAAAGGRYAPAATPSGITLSAGGDGPLATLTGAGGQTLSLGVPFTLPAPQVTGSTALYPSVLPGVDLRADVTDQGGFSEVLIVHDAQAAADPDLKKLTLSAQTDGLALAPTSSGGMVATTSDGTEAFSGPAPVMWDSSSAAPTEAPATADRSASSPLLRRAAAALPAEDAGDVAGGADSTADGPGDGAKVAPVGMTTSADGLTLTPDASVLSGPGTTYPVYIDPSVFPSHDPSMGSSHYDEVYSSSACDDAPQYDKAQTNGEGVGYQQWGGACGDGLERSYYSVPTSSMDPSWDVSSAKVTVSDTFAASFDCSHDQPVSLHTTDPISSSTDWDNKPGNWSSTDYPPASTTVASGSNPNSSCSNKSASFTVSTAAQSIATNNKSTWTMVLSGDESETSSNDNYLRFSSKLTLTVDFDVKPAVSNLHLSPAPSPNSCATKASPGWIGATTDNGTSSNVTMATTVNTYITGEQATAQFRIYDEDTANSGGTATLKASPTSGDISSGGTASEKIGFLDQDGHTYGYQAQATTVDNQGETSGWSSTCYFAVDSTPPGTPVLSDPTRTQTRNGSFPRAGDGTPDPVVYASAGGTTPFSVTAADTAPADTCTMTGSTCSASGVATFIWAEDRQPTVLDNDGTVSVSVSGTTTATGTINAPISSWGVHTLYVAAVDKAGNPSQTPASYTFTVPWNKDTPVAPGDLTGDGVPDMTAVTTTGDLELIPGDIAAGQSVAPSTDGYTGAADYAHPVLVSAPSDAPGGTGDSWSNYVVTHRGNLFGKDVDDLFALNTKAAPHQLYVVKNDLDDNPGGPQPTVAGFTLNRALPLGKPDCQANLPADRCSGVSTYDDSGWNQATDVLAPGDVYGTGMPDVITEENGNLWIYEGVSGGSLTNPILLGDGDWSGMTLLAPGQAGGKPVLWARDDASGTVYSYDLTLDPATFLPPLLHPPARTAVSSGVSAALCLDDRKDSTTPGNPVQVYTCNQTPAQHWTPRTDGTLRVQGECLDTSGNGTASNTLVVVDDCDPAQATQKWTAQANGSLLNTAANLCLDDPNSSTTTSTQVQIHTCNGTGAQVWSAPGGGALPAATAQTDLGLELAAASHPLIASPGDVNGTSGNDGPDHDPELWVTDRSGQLTEYPGAAAGGTTAAFGDPVSLGPVTSTASHVWSLTDGGSSATAADSAGLNATLSATGAGWADGGSGRPGTALSLDGTAGYAEATGEAVNDQGDFTVSAWVYLKSLAVNSTFVSQSDTAGNANGFQLYYSSGKQVWSFNRHNDDTTANVFTAAYGEKAVANTWTHLVGVYTASTGDMKLYVNGHLSSENTYSGITWSATGNLQIGRRLYEGAYAEYANAMISDVRVYPTALPPADAAAPGDTTSLTRLG